jgi:hypothetical protein
MSGVQGVLSKICCCIEIETGGLIVAVTRLIFHLIRIMVAISLLMGGIIEGVETTTLAPADGSTTAAGAGGGVEPPAGPTEPPAPPAPFLYGNERKLTKYEMEPMKECKKSKFFPLEPFSLFKIFSAYKFGDHLACLLRVLFWRHNGLLYWTSIGKKDQFFKKFLLTFFSHLAHVVFACSNVHDDGY